VTGGPAWLALRLQPGGDLRAPVREGDWDAGHLCAWLGARPESRPPVPGAVRVDRRLLDPDGPACRVSLVLLPRDRRPIADDPAAVAVRRDVLRDGRLAVSMLLPDPTHDPVHLAGGLSVARADRPEELLALRDDPFARLGPPRVLEVGPGLFGPVPAPPGPVLERYAGAPWPASDWPD
jgi:hypothetical protein